MILDARKGFKNHGFLLEVEEIGPRSTRGNHQSVRTEK